MNSSRATDAAAPRFRPCPWRHLESPDEVEHWIDEHNRSMRDNIGAAERGHGVRFRLTEGGAIVLQTSADGAVILDLSDEADWVAPLICAVAGVAAAAGPVWILADDKLVQLVLGLSGLIADSTLVVGHDAGRGGRRAR